MLCSVHRHKTNTVMSMCHNTILASNSHWILKCNQSPKYICDLGLSVHIHTSKVARTHHSKKQNTVYKHNLQMLPLHLPPKGLRKGKWLTREIDISNEESWQYWWYAFGQEKEVLHHLSVCFRLLAWSTGKARKLSLLLYTMHFLSAENGERDWNSYPFH